MAQKRKAEEGWEASAAKRCRVQYDEHTLPPEIWRMVAEKLASSPEPSRHLAAFAGVCTVFRKIVKDPILLPLPQPVETTYERCLIELCRSVVFNDLNRKWWVRYASTLVRTLAEKHQDLRHCKACNTHSPGAWAHERCADEQRRLKFLVRALEGSRSIFVARFLLVMADFWSKHYRQEFHHSLVYRFAKVLNRRRQAPIDHWTFAMLEVCLPFTAVGKLRTTRGIHRTATRRLGDPGSYWWVDAAVKSGREGLIRRLVPRKLRVPLPTADYWYTKLMKHDASGAVMYWTIKQRIWASVALLVALKNDAPKSTALLLKHFRPTIYVFENLDQTCDLFGQLPSPAFIAAVQEYRSQNYVEIGV